MRALLDQEFLQKDLYEEIEDVDFESAKEGSIFVAYGFQLLT